MGMGQGMMDQDDDEGQPEDTPDAPAAPANP